MTGLITRDFQWEFDGLLMGVGTPYAVTGFKGFLDQASVRGGGTPRARQHGEFPEPQFANGAVYDLDLDVVSTAATTFTAAVMALEAGTYPQATTRPLWFQLPGHGLQRVNVFCAARSIPGAQEYAFGVTKAALQFTAPDPLKYGATVTASTGLPVPGGGLTYPLVYPLDYGAGGVSGRVVVSNYGAAPGSPIFTVTGPIDSAGFQVTDVEDAVTVQFTGAVGAGDVFVIDTRTGAATLNGSTRFVSYTALPVVPAGGARTFAFGVLGGTSSVASLTVSLTPGSW